MGNTFKGKEVIAVNLVKWLTLFEAKSRKLKRRSWSWFLRQRLEEKKSKKSLNRC